MKISALLNYNIPQNYSRLSVPKSPVQFAYACNLPCDTVTFGNSSVGEEEQKQRDINTEPVFAKLRDKTPLSEIEDYLDDLREDEWNPNYVGKIDDITPTSLMTVVISRFEKNIAVGEWNHLYNIAHKICKHPDFQTINSETGEDHFLTAVDSEALDVAHAIIYSDDFQKSSDVESLVFYIDYAKNRMGYQELARTLEEIKLDKFGENGGAVADKKIKKGSSKENKVNVSALKKETITKLKKELAPYAVVPSENEPKSLDEVGGMFQAKKDIAEFILKPWDKDFRDRIFENMLNRPSGFLLAGPPGCGKTYILKAIAAQTGYPLYEVNLANIGASEGYKTQNDLKTLFDNLEKMYKLTGEPSILLLDELDSMAMDRKKCHTDWKKDDINALLMVLNNSAQRGIIVVGATNNPEDLDEAVKRSGRLDKQLKVTLPNEEEAKDIVEKILCVRPIGAELLDNTDVIAQKLKGRSPADISSILHNACLNAIYEYKDVATLEDFNKAFEALKKEPNTTRTVIKGFNS